MFTIIDSLRGLYFLTIEIVVELSATYDVFTTWSGEIYICKW